MSEPRDVVKAFREKWEREGLRPVAVEGGSAMCRFKMDEEDYVVDCGIGLGGRYAPKHLKVRLSAGKKGDHGAPLIMSGIARESFEEFKNGRRLYPLRVLHWAARKRNAVIPGYVSGETLDGVKHIGGKKKAGGQLEWVEMRQIVRGVVKLTQREYDAGVLAPDPVGEDAALPGEEPAAPGTGLRRVADICRHCHLEAACRYNHVDEPAW